MFKVLPYKSGGHILGIRKKRKFYLRIRRKNRHHILARSRKGRSTPDNLINLDESRHSAFHLLFGNRTFEEAAPSSFKSSKTKKGGGQ